MPTGAGKTVVLSAIAEGGASRGKPVYILVHRQELIRQTSSKLRDVGRRHGIIWAKQTPVRELVQVASVQTLHRRLPHWAEPFLIIIDEAHHAPSGTYRTIIDHYPNAKILGVTATPERTDGTGLNTVFDDLILGPTISELTDQGFLVPAVVYAPPTKYDLTGLPKRAGDWARDLLALEVDKPSITGDAFAEYQKHGHGDKGIAFCVSVEHARHVANQFSICGVESASIDGSLGDTERQRILEDFASGKIRILTSCDLISEGFDIPDAAVAILLRPTQSRGLHRQQVGRVLRPSPGKIRALILDLAGNCLRHGLPSYEPPWDLGGRKKKDGTPEEIVPPVRYCPRCFACFSPAPKCPECGYTFPVKSREIEEIDGELHLITPEHSQIIEEVMVAKTYSIEQLVQYAERKGYKYPRIWAENAIKSREKF